MKTIPPLPIVRDQRVRHIPLWPGYAISDAGVVWTCLANGCNSRYKAKHGKYAEWKIRKPTARKLSGHLWVRLTRDGEGYSTYVHRLVLLTFVGECPVGNESRHLDNDPKNNVLSNLQWNTKKVNQGDRAIFGTRTPRGLDGRFVGASP